MYKVTIKDGYSTIVFRFKNYEVACEFMKSALFAGEGSLSVGISFVPEVKEGEE